MPSFIEVGTIHKAKKFDGTTIVEFFHPLVDETILAFFTYSLDNYSPMLLEKMTVIDEYNAEIIWKNYPSKETAKNLSNTQLYVPEKIAEKHFDVSFDNNLAEYEVLNFGKKIGEVEYILENNEMQWIVVATEIGKELMIPMDSPHILNISDDKQSIEVSLTDEYIEMFSS